MLHEMGNRPVTTDVSKAFLTAILSAVLAKVVNCVLSRTPIVAKFYDMARPSTGIFRTDYGGSRSIACSSCVQQGSKFFKM